MERLFIVRPGQAHGESLTDDGRNQVSRLASQIAECIAPAARVTVLTCPHPLFRQTAQIIFLKLRSPERTVTEPQGILLLCPGASLAKVHKVVVQCQAHCDALILSVPTDVANTYPVYARQLLCGQEGEAPAVGEAHAICLSLSTGRFGVLHPGQSAVVPVA